MPKNITKYPYRPFLEPVPPIPIEDMGPMCITFDKKFLRYIIGALKVLEAPQTYESEQDTSVLAARDLLSTFIIHDDTCNQTCVEYGPSASIIGYAPKNPFTQAGEIPDGYIAPPFYVLEADILGEVFLGAQAGDVISGWFSLPVLTPAVLQGLARFRVTVQGPCTVELHLITIPNGGAAWIVDDDNILTLSAVDLNRDLVALPPETSVTVVQERIFAEAGEHHIDVSFLPQFNDTEVFIGYGGGLRKVVVCGDDVAMLDVQQNSNEPCILEKRNGIGAWTPFADLSLCKDLVQVPKSWRVHDGKAQVSIDGGTTFYDFPDGQAVEYGQRDPIFAEGVDKACVAAHNIVATIRGQVATWQQALAVGGAFMAITALITAAVLVFVTAGAAAPLVILLVGEIMALGSAGLMENLNDTFFNQLFCDIYETIGSDGIFSATEFGTFYDTVLGHGGDSATIISIWLDVNGIVGINNMVTSAGISECGNNPCSDDFYTEFNFEISPYPAAITKARSGHEILSGYSSQFHNDSAIWQQGLGWVQNMTLVNASIWQTLAMVKVELPAGLMVKKVEMDGYWIKAPNTVTGSCGGIDAFADPAHATNSYPLTQSLGASTSDGFFTLTAIKGVAEAWPINAQLVLSIIPENNTQNGSHALNGQARIRKLRIYAS